jgi:hypothetical protein
MKEEVKKIIQGKENEMVIARQCLNFCQFFCNNKQCLNYCCPLNSVYEKLRYKK